MPLKYIGATLYTHFEFSAIPYRKTSAEQTFGKSVQDTGGPSTHSM